MLLVYKSSNLQGIQWSFIIRLFFLYKSMHFKQNDFNNKNCLCGTFTLVSHMVRKKYSCTAQQVVLDSLSPVYFPWTISTVSLMHWIPFFIEKCWVHPQTLNLTSSSQKGWRYKQRSLVKGGITERFVSEVHAWFKAKHQYLIGELIYHTHIMRNESAPFYVIQIVF